MAAKPKSTRTKSSGRWLERQHRDKFTASAKKEGYRSRAAYKLLEIQEKDKILKKGMTVIDLGAAPGGFSQVAAEIVGQQGLVLALDKLPMDPIAGVDIILGDFQEDAVAEIIKQRIPAAGVDVIVSDMAPNLSGMAGIDIPRAMQLAELALDFADHHLKQGGSLLVKVFQGEGFQAYCAMLKERFRNVLVRKPKASRPESREVYLLAKDHLAQFKKEA